MTLTHYSYHFIHRMQYLCQAGDDERELDFADVDQCFFDLFNIDSSVASLRSTSAWQLQAISSVSVNDNNYNFIPVPRNEVAKS